MKNKRDLTGKIFNNLLVIRDSEKRNTKGEILWQVQCSCGNKDKAYSTSRLTSGRAKTCGCQKQHDNLPGTEKLRKILRRRNSKLTKANWTDKLKKKLILDFLEGATFRELEMKHKVDPKALKTYITDYRDTINTAWELNTIMKAKEGQYTTVQLDNALTTKYISAELDKVISAPEAASLTKQELVYGWIYVNSGSNDIALKESGFTEVLKKKHQTTVYKNLLGIFLREKPNVAQYISGLQLELVKDTEVSKQYVQSELIRQVEQLKEIVASDSTQRNRGNMLKAIELLGRSVGAFHDKLQIEQVDSGKAIDTLLNVAKEEVDAGSYRIEDA